MLTGHLNIAWPPTPAEDPAALTSRLISVSFQGKPAAPRHPGLPCCLPSSYHPPYPQDWHEGQFGCPYPTKHGVSWWPMESTTWFLFLLPAGQVPMGGKAGEIRKNATLQ